MACTFPALVSEGRAAASGSAERVRTTRSTVRRSRWRGVHVRRAVPGGLVSRDSATATSCCSCVGGMPQSRPSAISFDRWVQLHRYLSMTRVTRPARPDGPRGEPRHPSP